MKAGWQLAPMKLSENVGEPQGTVFVAVPDEEGNSSGMLAAVDELARLAETSLDYIAAVDTDTWRPTSWTTRMHYIGTVENTALLLHLQQGPMWAAQDSMPPTRGEILADRLNFDLCDVVE